MAKTQGKNLGAETNVEAMENGFYRLHPMACSVCFLVELGLPT